MQLLVSYEPKYDKVNGDQIVDFYMEYVVETPTDLRSVHHFSSSKGFSEKEFYAFFEDLNQVDISIWATLMDKSIETNLDDSNFEALSSQEKLLSLYFTFFQNLQFNQGFVLISLNESKGLLPRIKLWKEMKTSFTKYIEQVISSKTIGSLNLGDKIEKFRKNAVNESFYLQLAFLIDFWHKDDSDDKEKTDIAIEKTVRASMDLMDISVADSLFDWGKFVWNEKIMKNKGNENG